MVEESVEEMNHLRFSRRTYPDPAKYGVKKGQRYRRADGASEVLTVIDALKYSYCDDVVVIDQDGIMRRIDSFKLARVRYVLDE